MEVPLANLIITKRKYNYSISEPSSNELKGVFYEKRIYTRRTNLFQLSAPPLVYYHLILHFRNPMSFIAEFPDRLITATKQKRFWHILWIHNLLKSFVMKCNQHLFLYWCAWRHPAGKPNRKRPEPFLSCNHYAWNHDLNH